MTWSADLLTITIRSTLDPNCIGWTDRSTQTLLSENCPEITQNCQDPSEPLRFEFNIYFHVDDASEPRPVPFTPPKLSVDLRFIDEGGGLIDHIQETDDQPNYIGPSHPLETTFGTQFWIDNSNSVTISADIRMEDIDSGEYLVYADYIECVVIPCT